MLEWTATVLNDATLHPEEANDFIRLLLQHPAWSLAFRRGVTMVFYHTMMFSLGPILDRIIFRAKRNEHKTMLTEVSEDPAGSGDILTKSKRKRGAGGWRFFAIRFYQVCPFCSPALDGFLIKHSQRSAP